MIADIITKEFSHIFTMYFMAPCACIRKEWHIMNTCIIYFDKNNSYSVDNTRYNNIFECIYHIVVYCDIFLQCCDIVIGITHIHKDEILIYCILLFIRGKKFHIFRGLLGNHKTFLAKFCDCLHVNTVKAVNCESFSGNEGINV